MEVEGETRMKWRLETRKLSEIIPNEKNPRKISKKAASELELSLRRFGLCQPLVLSGTGTLLGGHQRARALRAIGQHDVEVYIPIEPLSQEEEEELTIRLNKNIGSWDFDLLANHWEPEKLLEWGFSMEELHLESIPEQQEPPKKFSINIACTDQDQLELLEKHIADIVNDFSGAKYKVKVK
jgi:hypothetical protein